MKVGLKMTFYNRFRIRNNDEDPDKLCGSDKIRSAYFTYLLKISAKLKVKGLGQWYHKNVNNFSILLQVVQELDNQFNMKLPHHSGR